MIDLRSGASPGARLLTTSDIADALREKARVKAAALQDAILTSASFSIIATDERGIIQLWNAGAERMLGYKAADVINRLSRTRCMIQTRSWRAPRR